MNSYIFITFYISLNLFHTMVKEARTIFPNVFAIFFILVDVDVDLSIADEDGKEVSDCEDEAEESWYCVHVDVEGE